MGEIEEARARIIETTQRALAPYIDGADVFASSAFDGLVGQSFPVHVRRDVDGIPNTIVGTYGTGTITGVEVDPDGKKVGLTMAIVPDGNISIELSFPKGSLSIVED